MHISSRIFLAALAVLLLVAQGDVRSQEVRSPSGPVRKSELAAALTASEWQRVDASIEHALAWLAKQQQADGSFPTRDQGQPAVTALCVMAYLSAGHQPGEGRYGAVIDKGIDFALTCQKDGGLISYLVPETVHVHQGTSHTAIYNHAITSLMLTEVYGQVSRERSIKVGEVVRGALAFTARRQLDPPKNSPLDAGGWRYLFRRAGTPSDSDLSVTGWQLMFLRSAKNAGFEIPDKEVEAAVAFVERSFDASQRRFLYGQEGIDRYPNRGLMGMGALSLALAGKHNTEMARASGDWLLAHPFDQYGLATEHFDRFHYGAYYCSNAMAQLGGKYWSGFFPVLAKTLLEGQQPDGSWDSESGEDAIYGSAYPTALSVLTLTPAYQLLPIYQR